MTLSYYSKIWLLLLILAGDIFSSDQVAIINATCKVHLSGYAYDAQSVTRTEGANANCKRYPPDDNLVDLHPENFILCNGTELRLMDCDLGSEQYSESEYYVWSSEILRRSHKKLLFIFPTRVNLTNITLHYYSDSVSGLPSLTFYAVPDNFEIWTAPTASYRYYQRVTALSPGEEPAGQRNTSIHFYFNTKKVLLVKSISSYRFAVSELEFFACKNVDTDNTAVPASQPISNPATVTHKVKTATNSVISPTLVQANYQGSEYSGSTTTNSYKPTRMNSEITTEAISPVSKTKTMTITTGVVIATVTVFTAIILMVAIALAFYFRKSAQRKIEFESSYSSLCREKTQQSYYSPNDLYDQIQLSPLTGQTEVISMVETENSNHGPQNLRSNDAKLSIAAILHPTFSSLKPPKVDKSVDIVPENNIQRKQIVVEKGISTADQKKVKCNEAVGEDEAPSIPPHTVEELYTAVKKKSKCNSEDTPPLPPHTVEELYTAVMKKPECNTAENTQQIPPHTVEELYTAVEKAPKDRALQDEEEAPPIPPHTVEELYTAVQKKLEITDKEQPPFIPPLREE